MTIRPDQAPAAFRQQDISLSVQDTPVTALVLDPADGAVARGGLLFLHGLARTPPDGTPAQFLSEASDQAATGVASILPQGVFPWTVDPSDMDDTQRVRGELARYNSCVDYLDELIGGRDKPIGVVGHDFGAMYAIALAATNRRIDFVVAAAPTARWSDWFVRFWAISGDRFDYMRALSPLDPVALIAERKTPLLLQFARHDSFIAEMTADELIEAAAEPTKAESYSCEHSLSDQQVRRDREMFIEERLGFGRQVQDA